MKKSKAFYVSTHRYGNRAGEPAEVIGVVMITPEHKEQRPCFHIRFECGDEDYVPINEREHYELISEEDIKAGKIPEVVY